MNRMGVLAFVVVGWVAACSDGGSPDGLSTEDVQDLPAGTARGEAVSGDYDVEAYTASCAGICGGSTGLYSFTICDVGDREDRQFEVRQDHGRLRIDGDESLFVSRLEGGINSGTGRSTSGDTARSRPEPWRRRDGSSGKSKATT